MERIVIGNSLDVEAEYGQGAMDHPFTLAIIIDGDEIISVEGYNTLESAKRGAEGEKYELLG